MWIKSWMMIPLVVLAALVSHPTGILASDRTSSDDDHFKLNKRSLNEPPFRRSPVDRLFIRFGRSTRSTDAATESLVSRDTRGGGKEKSSDSFVRFGKAADNFMRFGRGSNKDGFVRFGRPTTSGDSFVRFGKAADNFMRFGRARDNFMRFGRAKDNFMRFGRPNKENFLRFGKSYGKEWCQIYGACRADDDYDLMEKRGVKGGFVRFGKSPKNEDGFIRFGRRDGDDIIDSDKDQPDDDLDLQGDIMKNTLPRNKRFSARSQRDSEEIGQPPVLPDSQELSEDDSQTENTNVTHEYSMVM